MQLNHYLNFQGQTEKAFKFYQDTFGGEVVFLSHYGDLPPQDGVTLSDEDKQKVMHISLKINDHIILMGSDINDHFCSQHNLIFTIGTNHYISVNLEKHEQSKAYELFEKLSVGGTIEMPLDKTFWGALYGAFTDQFGIRWMINCQLDNSI